MNTTPAGISNISVWIGRLMSGLLIAFMLFDGGIKLVPLQVVLDASAPLGIPADLARPLGVIGLACTALYAFPRTSVLGAVLLTGYFGGAIATHLRVGDPLFTYTLFGVYLGLFAWAGLYLRDESLRALIPVRQRSKRKEAP